MSTTREIARRRYADEDQVARRRVGEVRLARFRATRDVAQRDRLFERYLPLARSLAGRYRHTSEPFDDLFQVACVGLLKALDRYDPARGTAFSSFAVPTILGELRRHLRDHTWAVRVPRDLQELAQRVGPASDELASELQRSPTVAELARRLDVGEEALLEARQAFAAHSPASLDEPLTDDEDATTRGELLCVEDAALGAVEDATVLDHYLAELPARSREILRLRFGADLKQREIGALLGISQMHVSRLLRQALEHLQALAAASDPSASPSR